MSNSENDYKEESLTISEILHEFVLMSSKNEDLKKQLALTNERLTHERDATEAFSKASKDWNSFTMMARVTYSTDDGLELDQFNLHFYIDLVDADKNYSPGDVLLIVGRIRSYREDDPGEGIHNAIMIEADRITLISTPKNLNNKGSENA
jgi:hypothetical protein